jgi:hypothetical protein
MKNAFQCLAQWAQNFLVHRYVVVSDNDGEHETLFKSSAEASRVVEMDLRG